MFSAFSGKDTVDKSTKTNIVTNTEDVLEGWLIKTNSKGERKLRFCEFKDDSFRACKPDKLRPVITEDIKENVNVKQIHNVVFPVNSTTKVNTFSINLLDGEIIEFEGDTASVWAARINKRIKDALEDISKNIFSKEVVHMTGKLMKTSHNKYQKNLQERFVKVQGQCLYYFKDEKDPKEAGKIDLIAAEFVRPYDRTPQCCMFEVFNDGRLYGFQANSNMEMNRWLTVIDTLRGAIQEHAEVTKIADSVARLPYRVNLFLNQSIDDYLFHIENELNYIFPEEYEAPEEVEEEEDEEEMRKEIELMQQRMRSGASSDSLNNRAEGVDETIDADTSKNNGGGCGGDEEDSSDGGASEDEEDMAKDNKGGDEDKDFESEEKDDVDIDIDIEETEKKNGDDDDNDSSDDGAKVEKEKEIEKRPEKPPKQEVIKRSLKENLDLAKGVVGFLNELIKEDVKYDPKQGIRYDILSIVLLDVNLFLNLRLSHILDEDNKEFNKASTQDIHSFIEWLSKYQVFCRRNKCVLPPDSPVHEYLDERQPNSCKLFEKIPILCGRYVNGNGSDKNGTATLLVDHCVKVWEKFLEAPTDALERHSDGSFFTHSPIDMWEGLNQHLNLAKQTKSPILHVMVADKIAIALTTVTQVIEEFVVTLDTESDIVIKEVELEFLCALANNNAMHIEETVSLVEHFESDELRARVDEIFDPVTSTLVVCGDRCLRKIAQVVMKDLEELFLQVFSHDWVEGSHMKTMTATCSDYIKDLEEFLMPFWSEKFVVTLLEACILKYIRSILFNPNRSLKPPDAPKRRMSIIAAPPPPPKEENFSSSLLGWGNKLKAMAINAVAQVQVTVVEPNLKSFIDHCREDEVYTIADEESRGRVASDVNVLNAFFSAKAGQDVATELLEILNEVSLYLLVPYDQISTHALARIAEFPTSAKPIFEVARHCMMIREDVTYEEYKGVVDSMTPALEVAPASSRYNADNGIPEGRLGLLYADLVKGQLDKSEKSVTEDSLAERLKIMAGVPLLALKMALADEDEEDDEEDADAEAERQAELREHASRNRMNSMKRQSVLKKKKEAISAQTDWLVDEVSAVLDKQDEEELEIMRQLEEEKRLLEEKKSKIGLIEFESHLEKKSPSGISLWQDRWFKINTRENTGTNSGDVPYVYTLMWFNKKGGSIANSYQIDKVERFSVCDCDRPLAVINNTNKLCLASEVPLGMEDTALVVKEYGVKDVTPTFSLKGQMYAFMVTIEGKDHYLRASKIDMMIRWVNLLALTTNFRYDATCNQWRRS